ncbi:MAG TPA: tetratricopeptide repeat protein [Rhizomicrobium sp.]
MTKARNSALIALALVLTAPVLARADAADDGNKGLAALQQGDNDTAIKLFTRALKSGRLAGDDKEFAYANRGRAYLKKGEYSSAIVDLDRARQMKPDDADAQNDLIVALQTEIPADGISGRPKQVQNGGQMGPVGQAIVQGFVNALANAIQQGNQ